MLRVGSLMLEKRIEKFENFINGFIKDMDEFIPDVDINIISKDQSALDKIVDIKKLTSDKFVNSFMEKVLVDLGEDILNIFENHIVDGEVIIKYKSYLNNSMTLWYEILEDKRNYNNELILKIKDKFIVEKLITSHRFNFRELAESYNRNYEDFLYNYLEVAIWNNVLFNQEEIDDILRLKFLEYTDDEEFNENLIIRFLTTQNITKKLYMDNISFFKEESYKRKLLENKLISSDLKTLIKLEFV
ncbi:hypothetical protein Bp8pS_237 [Bacillus phage vB_BpuM-BpSp]|nr:hypothetical protein Bp8pS_237 [Bacillus phage vB_BpuM-BpSp]